MAIRAIIELQAKSGKRPELVSLIAKMAADMRGTAGFLGGTRYEVLDNPDLVIEMAEWESAEARQAWMDQNMGSGALGPLMELLAAPFKATIVRQIE